MEMIIRWIIAIAASSVFSVSRSGLYQDDVRDLKNMITKKV